jgi:hypothetical protein
VNFKLTASILVVMLGLLAVVIYLRHQAPSRTSQTHGRVFKSSKLHIVAMTFSARGKPTLKMIKRGTHWYIISPRKAWGRDFAIGELATQIGDLKYHARIPIAATGKYSVARLGLKPAHDSVTLKRADGKTLHLAIGRSTLGGRLYVTSDFRHAFVVDRHWLGTLLKGESHFATKSLTRFHAAAVESITIKKGKTTMRIIRHGKRWVINSPLLARANPTKVTNWISNLQLLAAHRFTHKIEHSLKHVVFKVKIVFRKVPSAGLPEKVKAKIPPPLVVSFGSYTDLTHQYIRALSNANPNVAIVRSTSFSQLERSLSHFQDRALTRAKLSDAKRMVITRSAPRIPFAPASLVLTRSKGGWNMGTTVEKFIGGPLLPVSKGAVAKLLQKLSAIRAKSCDNTATPQLEHMQPIGTLTIDLPHRIHPLKIIVGPGNKGGLSPVKVSGWKTIYMVSTVRVKPLFPTAAALRSRTVAAIPALGINRIVLLNNGHRAELSKIKGTWKIEPGAKKVSSVDVASLTAELNPIRCHEWVTNAPTPQHVMGLSIYFRPAASTSDQGAKKAGKTGGSSAQTQHGVLQIWSKTTQTPAAGKKPAKTVHQYFARWLTGVESSTPWVFVPGDNLVSGVKQLMADTGLSATGTTK